MKNQVVLSKYGFFFFVVATTIGFATVNSLTVILVPYIRIFAITVSSLIIFYYLSDLKIDYNIFLSLVIVIFMNIYGMMRGLDNLTHLDYLPQFTISTIVVFAGITLIGISRVASVQLGSALFIVIFSSAWFLLLIFTNGFELSSGLGFNFEISTPDGRDIVYSQGVSKFFAVAAIASLWSTKKIKRTYTQCVLYIISIVCLFLSFLGGGRGDFLALIIIMTVMVFMRGWIGAIFVTSIILFAAYFITQYISQISDILLAARRFEALLTGSSLGQRDVLFSEGLHILSTEPVCFSFGCGFTYFQNYYGYDYGLYPHNILIEASIVWGVPLFLVIFSLFVIGVLSSRQQGVVNWLGFFFILVSLKSGDVFSSWFALSYIYFFSGTGLSRIIPKPRVQAA